MISSLESLRNGALLPDDSLELDELVRVLSQYRDLPLSSLSSAVARGLKRPPVRAKKATKAPAVIPTRIDPEQIAILAKRLNEAVHDADASAKIIAELKGDKSIKAGDVGGILSILKGRQFTLSRKPEGLKEIEQWLKARRAAARRFSDSDQL